MSQRDKTPLLPVECGACGWKSRRKPGNTVQCPKCGGIAGFQTGKASPMPNDFTRSRQLALSGC